MEFSPCTPASLSHRNFSRFPFRCARGSRQIQCTGRRACENETRTPKIPYDCEGNLRWKRGKHTPRTEILNKVSHAWDARTMHAMNTSPSQSYVHRMMYDSHSHLPSSFAANKGSNRHRWLSESHILCSKLMANCRFVGLAIFSSRKQKYFKWYLVVCPGVQLHHLPMGTPKMALFL